MVNAGAAPPNYDTQVGRVRLLTSDIDATSVTDGEGEYLWYGDEEIRAFIAVKGSPERAALHILRHVAMTPALQYKKWSSADLTVDGPAITRALRELINDIEKELDGVEGKDASDFHAIVNVGAPVAQPYLYPGATGVDIDTTLPLRII